MKFDSLKNFGSAIGSGVSQIYGVSLAYQSELNAFFQNRYGFDLFNNDEERCKINDIELGWVQVTSDERSGSVKTHSLEDRDSTLISSNVSNNNRKYSINVILTDYETKNKEQVYDDIVQLWQKKELCTISTDETIEDMIITKVSKSNNVDESLQFSIDFEVLEFSYLLKQGQVKEEEKTTLSKEQKTGVTGTKSSGINWEGFLDAYRNR